jgi:hypothetical protein
MTQGSNGTKAGSYASNATTEQATAPDTPVRQAPGTASGTPAADGFRPSNSVAGWIPGNEGQMLQQKVTADNPAASPALTVGTGGAASVEVFTRDVEDRPPRLLASRVRDDDIETA